MGLFDKKYCDICGEKIGLLGNRKLKDGNLCKDCAAKLSPFFSERKESTVEEIKEQLAYREENKEKVANFHPTRVIGGNMTLAFDEGQKLWLASRTSKWQSGNPDIMEFSQVTGVDYTIDENKSEIKRKDKDGKEVSFNPPRYKFDYDFDMVIYVNSPWFNEIRFQVNDNTIEMKNGVEYKDALRKCEEIKEILTTIHEDTREAAAEAAKPKTAVICPFCKATTYPDANGCCEYCGMKI